MFCIIFILSLNLCVIISNNVNESDHGTTTELITTTVSRVGRQPECVGCIDGNTVTILLVVLIALTMVCLITGLVVKYKTRIANSNHFINAMDFIHQLIHPS